MDSLSLREARRLALRAQGFGNQPKGGAGRVRPPGTARPHA